MLGYTIRTARHDDELQHNAAFRIMPTGVIVGPATLKLKQLRRTNTKLG